MNFRLDSVSQRIAFAFAISVLLHALLLWEPNIQLKPLKPELPPLFARLVALPSAPAKPRKPERKVQPAEQKTAPEAAPRVDVPPQEMLSAASAPEAADTPEAASAPVAADTSEAASAPAQAEQLAAEAVNAAERPPLPREAELTFAINKGTSKFRIGKAVHSLEIRDGHYVIQAVTKTVGLVSLFKSFELTQSSSGSYTRYGLQPEQFLEKRQERSGTQSNAVEFSRAAQRAIFVPGGEKPLPPDTQDILSVLYQFPPLANTHMATVSVSNGKKIENYDFEITPNEEIDSALGKLLTVRLHKLHAPNEEGLDIWLAQEYRLFPVKMRYFDRNGEVAGEAVITGIRVSDEQGARNDAVN
ncbi:MAG: DUF3108 domain-containing protein [Gammaproteobacteria bacterium]|nr:DUF3108 domain-containing protein [Gammaproteobacteria bacterium]MBU1482430.1 DUF3108 domain-containing protein [Gammaproteobacteria bacterium]